MIRQKVCSACLRLLRAAPRVLRCTDGMIGLTVCANAQVEPEIVGGIIVQMADKYIDLSIRTRVKKIEQLILEAV